MTAITRRVVLVVALFVVVNLFIGGYVMQRRSGTSGPAGGTPVEHRPAVEGPRAECGAFVRELKVLNHTAMAALIDLANLRASLSQRLASASADGTAAPAEPLECEACPPVPDCAELAPMVPAAPADRGSGGVWLSITIPTVPRRDVDYLNRVLDSIADKLSTDPMDPFYGKVKVLVVNNRPGEHAAFETARERFRQSPQRDHFVFVENNKADPDDASTDPGSANVPGARVRRQTRNVLETLRLARERFHATYHLMMEDDFLMCPNEFKILHYIIEKATKHRPWVGVRLSYGLNGFLLHGDDLTELARYLEKHQKRRPPDHLTVEWLAKETDEARQYIKDRILMAFRFNLLAHIGRVSSLRERESPPYPQCFEFLGEPVNFEVESFSPKQCPDTDLWPCDTMPADLRPPILWHPDQKMTNPSP